MQGETEGRHGWFSGGSPDSRSVEASRSCWERNDEVWTQAGTHSADRTCSECRALDHLAVHKRVQLKMDGWNGAWLAFRGMQALLNWCVGRVWGLLSVASALIDLPRPPHDEPTGLAGEEFCCA